MSLLHWLASMRAAVVIGVTILVFVGVRILDYWDSLRWAHTDNNSWSFSQLEVDLLKLQVSILEAETAPEDPAHLDKVRTDGEVLLSRIELLSKYRANNSTLLGDPRMDWESLNWWTELQAGYGEILQVIELDEAGLVAQLPHLDTIIANLLPKAREAAVDGLTNAATAADQLRGKIGALLLTFIFITTVILVTMVIGSWSRSVLLEKLRLRTKASDRNRALFERLVEASLDAIMVTDADGRILKFNAAAEAMFGFPARDTLGKDAFGLFAVRLPGQGEPQSPLPDGWEARRALIDQGRIVMPALRRDGSEFPAEVALVSGRDGEDRTVYFAFVRDFSEHFRTERNLRKARDAALSNEAAKTRFLGVVSHEMRTPLNGLVAALDVVLQTTRLTDKQRKFLNIARDCCNTALEQVEDLLELTRLSAHRDEGGDIVQFNLAGLLAELVQQSQPLAARRGNRIELTAPDFEVKGNRRLLTRTVMNLLGNAIKFTEGGVITVSAEVQAGTDGATVLVKVADTGIGIRPEHLERIFEDFETGEANYRNLSKGTGLGLGIAKRAVAQMGGEIGVTSELTQGSTFWFTAQVQAAPAVPQATETSAPGTVAQEVEGRPAASLSILVVEDSEINRIVLREMLESLGHSVTEACDGQQAVTALRGGQFDLVFMDVSMPVLDGVAATRQIRAEKLAEATPIVGLTAFAERSEVASFVEAGMQTVLTKPMSLSDLRAFLKEASNWVRPHVDEGAMEPVEKPAIMDETTLADLLDVLGPKLFADAWGRFQAECGEILAQIGAALEEGRLDDIARLAHKGIGSSGAFGARELGARLRDIETMAIEKRPRQVYRSHHAAISALERLKTSDFIGNHRVH